MQLRLEWTIGHVLHPPPSAPVYVALAVGERVREQLQLSAQILPLSEEVARVERAAGGAAVNGEQKRVTLKQWHLRDAMVRRAGRGVSEEACSLLA